MLALEADVPPADSLSVDAEAAGNEARFINDYRGIAPAGPNVVFARTRLAVADGPRDDHERARPPGEARPREDHVGAGGRDSAVVVDESRLVPGRERVECQLAVLAEIDHADRQASAGSADLQPSDSVV